MDEIIFGNERFVPDDSVKKRRYWTLLPWLREKHEKVSSKIRWFFLATAHTRINPAMLPGLINEAESQLPQKYKAVKGGHDGKESDAYADNRIFGIRMKDQHPKIIHHYLTDPNFYYPFMSSGVLIHRSVIGELKMPIKTNPGSLTIDIDAYHELFKHIYDRLLLTVTHLPQFCVHGAGLPSGWPAESSASASLDCVAYTTTISKAPCDEPTIRAPSSLAQDFQECDMEYRKDISKQLAILVKTTKQNHETRLPQLRDLWANDETLKKAEGHQGSSKPLIDLLFLSDDHQQGVIDMGVENPGRGHCSKFFGMLEHFYHNLPHKNLVYIVDDDTLVNVYNLVSFLVLINYAPMWTTAQWEVPPLDTAAAPSAMHTGAREFFKHSLTANNPGPQGTRHCELEKMRQARISPLYMGERYGLGHSKASNGYDYITGGGGILMDREAVGLLLQKCKTCRCNKPDDFDDMAVGRWFHAMRVPARHHRGFHQARPQDYHENSLLVERVTHPPISFHRIDTKNFDTTSQRYESLIHTDECGREKLKKDVTQTLEGAMKDTLNVVPQTVGKVVGMPQQGRTKFDHQTGVKTDEL
eukprot:GHVQ01024816.1.p1 GENE.GHVQ01024816.1~~GHVQ01024816.1.p1  ORF type:complete len:646 (-),score=74.99 GHVQ01024816.1:322-2076(-)